jgi:hypothetical protein
MYQIGPPPKLPPPASARSVYQVAACFEKQGGFSVVDPQTYLYYMEVARQVSDPAADRWVTFTDKTEQTIVGDFKRLWATNFLDDLSAETYDFVFSNGVVGKIILYNMEERQARQDRRLLRLEEGRDVEDRRGAEEEEHPHRARFVRRSRHHQAGRGHRPRSLRREGLRVRGRQAGDQAGQHRDQDRSTSPSTSPKVPRSASAWSTSWATPPSKTGRSRRR